MPLSPAPGHPTLRGAELHDRLTAIVLADGGVTDVATALSEVSGGSVLVLDCDHHVLASAHRGENTTGHPDSVPAPAGRMLREACEQCVRTRRTQHGPPGGGGGEESGTETGAVGYAATPVVAGDEVLGVLALSGGHLTACDLRPLEHAAQISALLLLRARTAAHAGHRLRGEFLEDVLDTPMRDPEGLRHRAARLGLALGGPHTVLTARCRDSLLREQVTGAAVAFAAQGAGLAGDYRGNVVILLPGDDPVAAARNLAAHLSRSVGSPVTVGAASAAPGAEAITEAHRDAARCLDVLLALDRDGEGTDLDELGVYSLLFGRAGQDELRRFVDHTIGPLLDYDARRGDLLRTALAYFACDANLAHTAVQLYVHINTLYQRIDRITSLLGPDWRHGDHALQVHLALKVHSVLSSS